MEDVNLEHLENEQLIEYLNILEGLNDALDELEVDINHEQ